MKDAIAFILGGLVIVGILSHCTGCIPRAVKEKLADGAFAEEQVKCADKFDTREAIDECRRGVRARWGIAETVRDAGHD